MAHNLATINNKTAMFATNRQSVWHGLGQRTDGAVTWEEAMRLAHLDWPVVLMAPYSRAPHNNVQELSGYKAVWRANGNPAFLGMVGEDYQPIQNREAFDFVDTLLEASNGAHYESAGALGRGETIWVLARVPDADITIAGTDDKSQSYLMFATGHAGNMSAIAKLTSVRVVCQNTLTSALSHEGAAFRVKHTKNAQQRLQSARDAMQGVVKDAKDLEQKLNWLASRRLNREHMTDIMDRLFPKPKEDKAGNTTRRDNVVADVLGLYERNDGNAIPEIRGTAYNLLNAVTEYADHYRPVRMTDAVKGLPERVVRAQSAAFGGGDELKEKALTVIMQTIDGKEVERVHIPDAPLLSAILNDN